MIYPLSYNEGNPLVIIGDRVLCRAIRRVNYDNRASQRRKQVKRIRLASFFSNPFVLNRITKPRGFGLPASPVTSANEFSVFKKSLKLTPTTKRRFAP